VVAAEDALVAEAQEAAVAAEDEMVMAAEVALVTEAQEVAAVAVMAAAEDATNKSSNSTIA
jgi:hypothetical protein